jgi:LAO/AO transport system kinase
MHELVERVRNGEVRALARAISMVENDDPGAMTLVRDLNARRGNADVVGITGPPGSGKSTLGDQLIVRWRKREEWVGVLAVDPSSPFTNGALLGDRVRMQQHAGDSGVYIRSMAARGHLGGLSVAVREAIRLVVAAGYSRLLLETVGVGQSELEVMKTADTTVVVLTPVSGDAVQIMKAGIIEIADVFVVNKAEMPDARILSRELRTLISDKHRSGRGEDWKPKIVLTTATSGEGVDELVETLEAHREWLINSGQLTVRRRGQLEAEVEAIVVARAQQRARGALIGGTMEAAIAGDPDSVDPYAVADSILAPQETEG